MNVVRTGAGAYIEIQGTAESGPFSEDQMRQMLDLAASGIKELVSRQRDVLDAAGVKIGLSGLFGRG
jgi:ribonuclease PH